MKTFEEVFTEITEGIKTSATGKKVKTFSRKDFDKLTLAYLNDIGHKTEIVKIKNGEKSITEILPVNEFRKFLEKILLDFGVDAQEASRVLTEYRIRDVKGLYEVVSEIVFHYMNAGKKFDFLSKDDFEGSMWLERAEASTDTITYTDNKTGERVSKDIQKEAHLILKKKSVCPTWKRKSL